MKFLRTIRFDDSDKNVFDASATSGEAAISGGFAFTGITKADLTGKTRQAFANGFLGVPSFGRSTFASIAELNEAEVESLKASLTWHFIEVYGAPDAEAAGVAAQAEIDFIAELCQAKPVNTVFAIRRELANDGAIREEYREIEAPAGEAPHARIWDVVEDDG